MLLSRSFFRRLSTKGKYRCREAASTLLTGEVLHQLVWQRLKKLRTEYYLAFIESKRSPLSLLRPNSLYLCDRDIALAKNNRFALGQSVKVLREVRLGLMDVELNH